MINSDLLLFHIYCPHDLVFWKRYCLQCVLVEDDLEGLAAIRYSVNIDEGLWKHQVQFPSKACVFRHDAEWVR